MSTDLDKDADRIRQVGSDKTVSQGPEAAAAENAHTSEKDDDVGGKLVHTKEFLVTEVLMGEHGHGEDDEVSDGHDPEHDPDP
ncbi:hypothetical protein BGZ47_003682, partial [Haplosporangium gracile]